LVREELDEGVKRRRYGFLGVGRSIVDRRLGVGRNIRDRRDHRGSAIVRTIVRTEVIVEIPGKEKIGRLLISFIG